MWDTPICTYQLEQDLSHQLNVHIIVTHMGILVCALIYSIQFICTYRYPMHQLWEFVLVVSWQEQVSWKVPSSQSRELDGDVFAARHAHYEAGQSRLER